MNKTDLLIKNQIDQKIDIWNARIAAEEKEWGIKCPKHLKYDKYWYYVVGETKQEKREREAKIAKDEKLFGVKCPIHMRGLSVWYVSIYCKEFTDPFSDD